MKKRISLLVLCILLLLSTLCHAEQALRTAVFDAFVLTVEKVSFRDGTLTVGLSQVFQDQETAKQYQECAPDDASSPEEVDAHYRSFFQSIVANREMHLQHLKRTNEAEAKAYEEATTGRFKLLMVSFRTPEGKPFFPEGSFTFWEFGSNSAPRKQSDGTWKREIQLVAKGFATSADGLIVELCVFDPQGDAAYTGEVQQTLYVKLPKSGS